MPLRITLFAFGWLILVSTWLRADDDLTPSQPQTPSVVADRFRGHSPTELYLTDEETHLLVLNHKAGSVTLHRLPEGNTIDEILVGDCASGTLFDNDARLALVNDITGELLLVSVDLNRGKLGLEAAIMIGMEPRSVAVDAKTQLAYVSRWAADQVAVVDLQTRKVIDQIDVPGQPRNIAMGPDGQRLAVAVDAERGLSIVDLKRREVDFTTRFAAMNVGLMRAGPDSKYVYFPWMVYRENPISQSNIRRGWVLASRLGRQRLDVDERREAFSLDPEGRAVADPHAVDLSADGKRIIVSSPGTHELLVFAAEGLPWQAHGSSDHIIPELLHDPQRFARIELGGRPLDVKLSKDSRTAYVANYLSRTVQIVDIAAGKLVREIPVGEPAELNSARRGEAIFFDAQRSFEQWYSCHSCHRDGGGNVKPIDTRNDGTQFTFKTVLPLHNVADTAPWTWHGWQTDLRAAMRKSLTDTMLGPDPTEQDVTDLIAYLGELELPPNPFREAAQADPAGKLAQAIERGRELFNSNAAGCTNCHTGPHFTDGEIHDVGTGGASDRYRGYNTPSLLGVYRKARLLHDGSAGTIQEAVRGDHAPHKVAGERELTDAEIEDLAAYLKSL